MKMAVLIQEAPKREIDAALADKNPMTVIVAGFGHLTHAYKYAIEQKANIAVVYPNSVNFTPDNTDVYNSHIQRVEKICEPYLHVENSKVNSIINNSVDPLYKMQLDILARGKTQ